MERTVAGGYRDDRVNGNTRCVSYDTDLAAFASASSYGFELRRRDPKCERFDQQRRGGAGPGERRGGQGCWWRWQSSRPCPAR